MSRLSVFDAGFLAFEDASMPMHVGGLALYSFPKEVKTPAEQSEYLHGMIEKAKQVEDFRHPFGKKLERRLGQWYWEDDKGFDIDYHLRHVALPHPGRYREMFATVSRMHGKLLARERPLWESTLIEGLESGQYAMYSKMHHAMIDGLGAMQLLNDAMSSDPDERGMPMPFATRKRPKKARQPRPERPSQGAIADFSNQLQSQFGVAKGAASGVGKMLNATLRPAGNNLVGFRQGPRTVLNGEITGARRVVAQSYSLDRIKRICKAYDATMNDIVVAMSSGALRQHLFNNHVLPEKPLIAMAPVGLKARVSGKDAATGDAQMGNAVGAIMINLGTHIGDPIARLRHIQASTKEVKALLGSMTKDEIMAFTAITSTPSMLLTAAGLAPKVKPNFNIVISNVPGPKERLYWNGARLDGNYPISIPMQGMAMNFTVMTYVDSLDFGITACRKSVPKAQRLIDYLEQSLVELEDGAGLR